MKIATIKFSNEAKKSFILLIQKSINSKQEKTLLRAILKKSEFIKQDDHYGDAIAKKLIPREYKEKYNVTNLFRVELPNYWRMLYTLRGDNEVEIIAFVLDIINHKQYDKKFKYKKK